MELALLVYGISVMSAITGLCLFLCVFLVLFVIFQLISYTCDRDNNQIRFRSNAQPYDGSPEDLVNWKSTKSFINKCGIIFIILASVITLIPSKQTAYVMVAAYAAQSVAQSPRASILSEKVLKVIEKDLDNQLDQIKK
jgi:hypothetical protein